MLEPVLGTMTSKLCNFLATAEIAIFLGHRFRGVLGVDLGA